MEILKDDNGIEAGKDYGEILSFITYPVGESMPVFRTGAVIMAIRLKGSQEYLVLNNGKPMIYPGRDVPEPAGDIMRGPYLFRKDDGNFGLIAANNNLGPYAYIYHTDDLYSYTDERLLRLSRDDSHNIRDVYAVYDKGFYRIYWRTDTTDNTWHETLSDLNEIISIQPILNSKRPPRGIQNLGTLPLVPSPEGTRENLSTLVPAREASAISISKNEYDYINLRIGTRLHNTGVEPFEKLRLPLGSTIELPAQAKLIYNDGTSKPMSVNWNQGQLDEAQAGGAGTYKIEGFINRQVYETPLVRYRADPNIFRDPDPDPKTGIHYYYLTGSYPHWSYKADSKKGYDQIVLRRSPTIQGLSGTVKQEWEPPSVNRYADINERDPEIIPAGPYNSLNCGRFCHQTGTADGITPDHCSLENCTTREEVIWKARTAGHVGHDDDFYRYIWAPEIHKINGRWYILFTSAVQDPEIIGHGYDIRPAILVLKEGGDPMVSADWEEIHRIEQVPGDPYVAWHALDMTYIKTGAGTAAEKDYITWTTWANHFAIASIDPQRPWVLKSPVSIIRKSSYMWEWIGQGRDEPSVIEAQAVFIKDGMVSMAYSGSAVDLRYSIGMMTAPEDADLLDPASWAKSRFPLLATQDLPRDDAGNFIQSGPGHNSFTFDADGNMLIIYHARHPLEENGGGDGGLYDPGRHGFVKPVQINRFGDIIFYMTPEEELNPANISVKIIVEKADSGLV